MRVSFYKNFMHLIRDFFSIALIIGLPISLIGAYVGFLITYQEYTHHYTDKQRPFQLAVQTGIFVFVVFLIILSVLAVAFSLWFK